MHAWGGLSVLKWHKRSCWTHKGTCFALFVCVLGVLHNSTSVETHQSEKVGWVCSLILLGDFWQDQWTELVWCPDTPLSLTWSMSILKHSQDFNLDKYATMLKSVQREHAKFVNQQTYVCVWHTNWKNKARVNWLLLITLIVFIFTFIFTFMCSSCRAVMDALSCC